MKIDLSLVAAAVVALGSALSAQETPAGWKSSWGLTERMRVERRNNFDFNDAAADKGGYMQQGLRIGVKAELPGKYELFAEGMDLRVANDKLVRPAQDDVADLHQAYAVVKGLWLNLPLELKVGRQEFKYGAGRLIGSAVWNNRTNHEDGAVLKYRKGAVTADAFWGAKVSYDPDGWNEPNRHDIVGGVYATWNKGKDAPLVDVYYITNYNTARISTLNRNTIGIRGQMKLPGDVLVEAEAPYQFGKQAQKKVHATALHVDASREFRTAWSPRVMLGYNYASGDDDKNDSKNTTFVPLYQSGHDVYSMMDLFRLQNLAQVVAECSVKPVKELKVTAALRDMRLDSTRDYWYNLSGSKVKPVITAAADNSVGREVALKAALDMGGGLNLEAGYAHFFAGQYLKDTGAHDDADFGYFQIGFKL